MDTNAALFNQLADTFAAVDAEGVVSLPARSDDWIINRYNELDIWLIENDRNGLARTQEARDKQSERQAVKLEMLQREII